MIRGSFTQYVDVAQVVLYAFWVFFAGLIFYLRREDKREGYPLVSEIPGHTSEIVSRGAPAVPPRKRFRLFHGGDAYAPPIDKPEYALNAVPAAAFPGAPLEPLGNPLVDGLGPASWAYRLDEPDLTIDDKIKIVPLRDATEYRLHKRSLDPRGMEVIGNDTRAAGMVVDIWLDEIEEAVRYLEVSLTLPGVAGDRVLVPATYVRFRRRLNQVVVQSLPAADFANVPRTRETESVTRWEEDKLVAYFGGGALYGSRSRRGPLV